MNLVSRSPRPVVTITDGELYASSRDVATFFEKNHRDVVRAIDAAIAEFAQDGLAHETSAYFCADVYVDEKQKLANELTSARALLEDARRQMSLVEEKLRADELQLGRRRDLTG